ncbi:MAG: phage baseplate assembly protein V, partial [Crocinitomicaceae bacterium]|nr:phage baseplate assembly protein V [Crocinitomicaceae bacterium]
MSLLQTNSVSYEVLLEGELTDISIIGLSVQKAVNKIPKAQIEMHYRRASLSGTTEPNYKFQKASSFDSIPEKKQTNFIPGKKVQIKLGRNGQSPIEVFSGYIVKQSIEATNDGSIILCIECKHQANQLTLNKKTRALHHLGNASSSSDQNTVETIDEISVLKKIVSQGSSDNLSLKIQESKETKIDHENIVQYNCSDWDFLVMRSEVLGYVCNPKEDIIELIKPTVKDQSSYNFTLGDNLYSYEAEYDETHRKKEITFSNWNPEDEDQKNDSKTNKSISDTTAKIQQDQFINYNGDLDQKEISSYLDNNLNRQELGKIRGLAKVWGTSEINLLDTVTISGFESVWDRDALVSGIKHTFYAGTWHTYIQCGLSNHSHAELYNLNDGNSNCLIPSASGLIYGKVDGYIKGTDGQELAKIIITAADDKKDSRIIYARLSTFSAGQNGGAIFRPFEGDEVVLGFINNDPRFPVILGAMYNSINEPKYPLKEEGGSELTQNEIGFS